jgi:hypothetical protein
VDRDYELYATRRVRYKSLLKQAAAERLVRERASSLPWSQTGQVEVMRDIRKLAELLARLQANEPPTSGWTLNLNIYRAVI